MKTKQVCCDVDGLVRAFFMACGPTGLELLQLWQSGRHRELAEAKVDPLGFSNAEAFFDAYIAVNFLKKYPQLQTGIDTRAVAMEKFRASEVGCKIVNERFVHYRMFPFGIRSLLERARREIYNILHEFSWDLALPHCSHGPGSSVGLRRSRGHPFYKFGCLKPTATAGTLALVEAYKLAHPPVGVLLGGTEVRVVPGSKQTTVAKDARSDRAIAIEPLWNMFFQKGIGGLMRSRLKRAKCDLDSQARNQYLAYAGSVSGDLATLDLSSASDSVSRGLVEFLLPEDWLNAMNLVRSERSLLLDGEEIYLQKYSSMGNGYTFELESVIFLALARAVSDTTGSGRHNVSVYGDDIIVPVQDAELLMELLAFCGFSVNRDKSFWSGPFRESCGKHYFRGRDVTPFYLKKVIDNTEVLLWALNSISRLAHRYTNGSHRDASFKPAWDILYASLDSVARSCSVPEGYGDMGVLRDFDEVCPKPTRCKNQVEGFITPVLHRKYVSFRATGQAALVLSLFCLERVHPREYEWCDFPYAPHDVDWPAILKAYHDHIVPRVGSTVSSVEIPTQRYYVRKKKLHVGQWSVMGPWA